jgi:uncharacterized sporulation protein YeaH/YhbH (DUF444 family)
VKKIVAHIQRTVTITTINTAMDVSVSEDDTDAPAIRPGDPLISITVPEGDKDEKTNDVINRTARRKPGSGVRSDRRSKHKSRRANGSTSSHQ